MPSLVKKMFDTMPLQGVLGAVGTIAGASTPPTLGQMKRFVRRVSSQPPPYTAQPSAPSAGTAANDAAIWGWRATGDPSFVEEVTCRVRDMSFAKHLVLERLDFGYAPTDDAKHFRSKVLVVFNGKSVELPLSTEYHLVSFTTDKGYIHADKNAALWPLESYHDESLLHVFVYDIDRVKGTLRALTSPQHPDRIKTNEMMGRLNELEKAQPDDTRNAGDVLFVDDLWDPSPANTPPTGTVPENVDLSLKAVRVMVACSLTACRERDDFQPGKLGGVGRLYPHVMVVATSALDRVEAGVHFKRPEKTKMLDHGLVPHAEHHHSGYDEMLPAIKSLMLADANAGGTALENTPKAPGPLPYWANMFSYYVVDPIDDPEVGDKLIPVVRRAKPLARNQVGWVTRDCVDIKGLDHNQSAFRVANKNRVLKRERQGYFDNLHMAPRMRVKDPIAEVGLGHDYTARAPANKTAWKMDEVVMAPFCAHDCFHIHWRWSDNLNNEQATFGWGPVKPWSEVGRAMVPENQGVFLQLLGHAEFSYLAHAHDVPKNAWQPFCHHGTGYALHVGERMEQAKEHIHNLDNMSFWDAGWWHQFDGNGWALFYWRLRYRLVPRGPKDVLGVHHDVALEERFSFNDEPKALEE